MKAIRLSLMIVAFAASIGAAVSTKANSSKGSDFACASQPNGQNDTTAPDACLSGSTVTCCYQEGTDIPYQRD